MSDWIPVSERLPDDEGYYLVTIVDVETPVPFERKVFGSFYEFTSGWYDTEDSVFRVIAWKSVPTAYSEKI